MHVSSVIWVESIIETTNKRYTISAGVPSQAGGISCIATFFADGVVNQPPIVGKCYQVIGNFAPRRGNSPPRLEITS